MAKPWLEGAANGRYMGEIMCTACNSRWAHYKTAKLCRRCYDRQRQTGSAVGPAKAMGGNPQYDECVALDCHKPVKGLGMCNTHYSQYRRMLLPKPS
jgi:hypothetical protein